MWRVYTLGISGHRISQSLNYGEKQKWTHHNVEQNQHQHCVKDCSRLKPSFHVLLVLTVKNSLSSKYLELVRNMPEEKIWGACLLLYSNCS